MFDVYCVEVGSPDSYEGFSCLSNAGLFLELFLPVGPPHFQDSSRFPLLPSHCRQASLVCARLLVRLKSEVSNIKFEKEIVVFPDLRSYFCMKMLLNSKHAWTHGK